MSTSSPIWIKKYSYYETHLDINASPHSQLNLAFLQILIPTLPVLPVGVNAGIPTGQNYIVREGRCRGYRLVSVATGLSHRHHPRLIWFNNSHRGCGGGQPSGKPGLTSKGHITSISIRKLLLLVPIVGWLRLKWRGRGDDVINRDTCVSFARWPPNQHTRDPWQ